MNDYPVGSLHEYGGINERRAREKGIVWETKRDRKPALPESLARELQRLRNKIEKAGYSVHAVWMDEYGGTSSVKLLAGDRLEVKENATRHTD